MKNPPNSKTNLDRAIQRFAGSNIVANELRVLMANTIVAQLIGQGVVKGGSGLKFRYGDAASRVTLDLDTAWNSSLDSFLKDIKSKLTTGWNGFDGYVVVQKQATPRGIPFEYVMQPCDVKLNYKGTPWFTVKMEISHNEIGNADEIEMISSFLLKPRMTVTFFPSEINFLQRLYIGGTPTPPPINTAFLISGNGNPFPNPSNISNLSPGFLSLKIFVPLPFS